MKLVRVFMRILLLPLMALMAAVGMLLAVIAAAAAVAAIFTGAVAAIVAYVKREDWTLPAFRWARDRTGRWSMTPWSSNPTEEAAPPQAKTAGV
jgi:hypothetical protein